MLKATKVRLYPTKEQQRFLCGQFGAVRFCYNKSIDIWQHRYKVHGQSVSIFKDVKPLLAVAKKSRKYGWLGNYDSIALQEAVRHAHGATVKFLTHKAGYPRFKSRRNEQSSYHCTGISVGDTWIRVPKVGKIKVVIHRQTEGKLKSITLRKDCCGDYYASLLYETDEQLPEPEKTLYEDDILGTDLGLKSYAAYSNGKKKPNPKPLKRALKKLRRAQKSLSRKKKGSANREKARKILAKAHRLVARRRADFIHKLSRQLIDDNQAVVVESLQIKNMMKNHHLARAIGDAAWGEFVRCLEYKAKKQGKWLIAIDAWFPSSKTCSACGHVLEKLKLSTRSWTCPHCGKVHDRDINAAINIKRQGIVQLKAAGLTVLRTKKQPVVARGSL